jgi:hypothetical protein
MRRTYGCLAGVLLVLSACGSGSSSDSAASTATKDLFSSWAEDGTTFVLDMHNGSFGTFPFTYLITGGAICDCTLAIGGTQTSGNAVMSGCTYRNGTGGGSDPGCASLNASYTYMKPESVLSVCTGGTCYTYH